MNQPWIKLTGVAIGDGYTAFYSPTGGLTQFCETYEAAEGYSAALEDLGHRIETINLDENEHLVYKSYIPVEDNWHDMMVVLKEESENE